MRRERVSEDIYIFTSELYAQVTASVILTEDGAIVIDTLPFPTESREMADFVHRRSERGARYVIDTHFHADHIYGNYFYPEAEIISHQRCREMLLEFGQQQLDAAKAETPGLEEVRIVTPDIVFGNEMGLHLAGRSLRLMHLPGHSPDGIGALVEGDKILFAGDAVMPLPYFVWGDRVQLKRTLQRIHSMGLENIVQGHGEILLRGEIPDTLTRHMDYLDCIHERVSELVQAQAPERALAQITVESCGESSIPLDGLVRQLHQTNLVKLYRELKAQQQEEAARGE